MENGYYNVYIYPDGLTHAGSAWETRSQAEAIHRGNRRERAAAGITLNSRVRVTMKEEAK